MLDHSAITLKPNIYSLVLLYTQKDIMIKPDGVQRGLIGEIIKRFEQKGYKLIAMKLTAPGKAHMETHYADLAGKKFFPGLIEYMTSGPVCEYIMFGCMLLGSY